MVEMDLSDYSNRKHNCIITVGVSQLGIFDRNDYNNFTCQNRKISITTVTAPNTYGSYLHIFETRGICTKFSTLYLLLYK